MKTWGFVVHHAERIQAERKLQKFRKANVVILFCLYVALTLVFGNGGVRNGVLDSIGSLSNFQMQNNSLLIGGRQTKQNNTIAVIDSSVTNAPYHDNHKHRTLWILTCQTALQSKFLTDKWIPSVNIFAELNQHVQGGIKVQNICEKVRWKGFMTKPKTTIDFIQNTILKSKNENQNNRSNKTTAGRNQQPPEQPEEEHIIMFTDADVYFNPYAMDLTELFDRYDHARQGKNILVSAEPACWIGRYCTKADLKRFYPNAPKRSSCPQFINSGQYMGRAQDLIYLLHSQIEMDNDPSINLPSQKSDQARLTIFNTIHPELLSMDLNATIFRNAVFGFIDGNKTQKAKFTCGTEGIHGIHGCGKFSPPRNGATLNETTKVMHFDHGITECSHVHTVPFSIHFPGATRSQGSKRNENPW